MTDGPERVPLVAEEDPPRALCRARPSRKSPHTPAASAAPRRSKRRKASAALPEGVTCEYETDTNGRVTAKLFKSGKQVGSAQIRNFPHAIQITNFQIARGSRRQGIGTAFQFYIEAQLGKPAVPDGMLSNAEYRRWTKIDPVAVADYVKGTKTYTPRPKSDAYVAAHTGKPVPGSRAALAVAITAAVAPSMPAKKPARKPRSHADPKTV